MPNWCNNTVTINHPDKSKLHALVEAINEGKFCQHVIPTPEDLNITSGWVGADDSPEQMALVAKQKANLAKYGYKDWYDFQTAMWGTKWDVQPYETVEFDEQHDPSLTFGFDSAWSPPIGVYEVLVEQGYSVKAYYYEPGMAYAGRWEDMVDECFELSGMNSDQVREELPVDLDDCMNISESMAEYEEEERLEEDLYRWTKEGAEAKANEG